MRLRNKKTGEILGSFGSFIIQNPNGINCEAITKYNSLAELNAEWEDVPEEPKGYWFIDCAAPYPVDFCEFNEDTEDDKEIGNYFETKEEAKKAVEKLKAWKRLKDKGFRFNGVEVFSEGLLEIDGVLSTLEGIDNVERLKIIDDLDLLFSGDEE